MALNRNVIGGLSFVAALLSIPIIGAGVSLMNKPDNSCVKIVQWPILVLGVLILLVGLAGAVGGFMRIPWLLIFYLIAMLVLIVLLGCLVGFVYTVTGQGGSGHPVPSRVYLEYHLNDFSGWMKRRVRGPFKWDRIKYCLASRNFCAQLNQTYTSAEVFFKSPLSPIESGCCKPPTLCGYQYITPTNWIDPINMVGDMDCLNWNNDPSKLCYDCDSCKGGLLANLRREWRQVNVILAITLAALIVVYLSGCAAFRQAKTDSLFDRYKQGYNT